MQESKPVDISESVVVLPETKNCVEAKTVPESSSASSQMYRTEMDRIKTLILGSKAAKPKSGVLLISKNELGEFRTLSNDDMMYWIWHNGLERRFRELVTEYCKDHPNEVMYKQGWRKNATSAPPPTNQSSEKPFVLVDAKDSKKLDKNLIGILRMKPPTPQLEKLIKKAETKEKNEKERRRQLESVLELYLNNSENREAQRKEEEEKRIQKKKQDEIFIRSIVNDFIEKERQKEKTEKAKKGDPVVVKDNMEIS
jgi:hypothetical protein